MGRNNKPQPTTTPPTILPPTLPADLRERILADFAALKIPLRAEQLDAVLARAGRDVQAIAIGARCQVNRNHARVQEILKSFGG